MLLNVNLNPLCVDRAYKDSPKEFFMVEQPAVQSAGKFFDPLPRRNMLSAGGADSQREFSVFFQRERQLRTRWTFLCVMVSV